jgi:hypothetical protein
MFINFAKEFNFWKFNFAQHVSFSHQQKFNKRFKLEERLMQLSLHFILWSFKLTKKISQLLHSSLIDFEFIRKPKNIFSSLLSKPHLIIDSLVEIIFFLFFLEQKKSVVCCLCLMHKSGNVGNEKKIYEARA